MADIQKESQELQTRLNEMSNDMAEIKAAAAKVSLPPHSNLQNPAKPYPLVQALRR